MPQNSDDRAGEADSGASSDILALVWAELVRILGAPAAAALLRRSAKRLLHDYPEFKELAITRQGFDYVYTVPADWKQADKKSHAAVEALLQELCSVLLEMTGPVVVRRLKDLPQLAKFDLPSLEDKLGGAVL